MQLSNVMVRLGGLMSNTVPKMGITPAEILVLRYIHGEDGVVDIRPVGFDKKRRHDEEFARLAATYDPQAGAMSAKPGEDEKSIMVRLFPGALKRLPLTLAEIGVEGLDPEPEVETSIADAQPEPEAEPEADEPEADEPEIAEVELTDSDEITDLSDVDADDDTTGNAGAEAAVVENANADGAGTDSDQVAE